MRKFVKDAAGTPEAEPPTQGVTLSIPTHMAAPSHVLILREGPKPARPRGRIPRVARLSRLRTTSKNCSRRARSRPRPSSRHSPSSRRHASPRS
jgi:hypothetical protein